MDACEGRKRKGSKGKNKGKEKGDYVPIHKRIHKIIKDKQENIEKVREQINKDRLQKEKEESKSRSRSKSKGRNKHTNTYQGFNNFMEKEKAWLKKRDYKTVKQREKFKELEIKDCVFKPKVTSYTPRGEYTSRNKEDKPVWDRLYGLSTRFRYSSPKVKKYTNISNHSPRFGIGNKHKRKVILFDI